MKIKCVSSKKHPGAIFLFDEEEKKYVAKVYDSSATFRVYHTLEIAEILKKALDNL